MKDTILPIIEQEINQGKHFTQLRQIYHSLILALWYKTRLKQTILNQAYSDKRKIKGIDLTDPKVKQQIYSQYTKAYKQGLYDYIKKDYSPKTKKYTNRRYYSGGIELAFGAVASSAMSFQPANGRRPYASAQISLSLIPASSSASGEVVIESLTKELAARHADILVKIHNAIPRVNWTQDDLLADAKGDRAFYAKWKHSLIAFDPRSHEPVGFITAYERPGGEMQGVDDVSFYLHRMAVLPTHRNQGIGTRLIQEAVKRFRNRGFIELEQGQPGKMPVSIQTNFDNQSANSLYTGLGFKAVGRKDYQGYWDHIYLAEAQDIIPASNPAPGSKNAPGASSSAAGETILSSGGKDFDDMWERLITDFVTGRLKIKDPRKLPADSSVEQVFAYSFNSMDLRRLEIICENLKEAFNLTKVWDDPSVVLRPEVRYPYLTLLLDLWFRFPDEFSHRMSSIETALNLAKLSIEVNPDDEKTLERYSSICEERAFVREIAKRWRHPDIVFNGQQTPIAEARQKLRDLYPNMAFAFNARVVGDTVEIGVPEKHTPHNHMNITYPHWADESKTNVYRGKLLKGEFLEFSLMFDYLDDYDKNDPEDRKKIISELEERQDDFILIVRAMIGLEASESINFDSSLKETLIMWHRYMPQRGFDRVKNLGDVAAILTRPAASSASAADQRELIQLLETYGGKVIYLGSDKDKKALVRIPHQKHAIGRVTTKPRDTLIYIFEVTGQDLSAVNPEKTIYENMRYRITRGSEESMLPYLIALYKQRPNSLAILEFPPAQGLRLEKAERDPDRFWLVERKSSSTSSPADFSFENWEKSVEFFVAYPQYIVDLHDRIDRLGSAVRALSVDSSNVSLVEQVILEISNLFSKLKLNYAIDEEEGRGKPSEAEMQKVRQELGEAFNKLSVIADMAQLRMYPYTRYVLRMVIEDPYVDFSEVKRVEEMKLEWSEILRLPGDKIVSLVKSAFENDPETTEAALVIIAEELMTEPVREGEALKFFAITKAERLNFLKFFLQLERYHGLDFDSPETLKVLGIMKHIHSESVQGLSRLIEALAPDIKEQLSARPEIQDFIRFSKDFNSPGSTSSSPARNTGGIDLEGGYLDVRKKDSSAGHLYRSLPYELEDIEGFSFRISSVREYPG